MSFCSIVILLLILLLMPLIRVNIDQFRWNFFKFIYSKHIIKETSAYRLFISKYAHSLTNTLQTNWRFKWINSMELGYLRQNILNKKVKMTDQIANQVYNRVKTTNINYTKPKKRKVTRSELKYIENIDYLVWILARPHIQHHS